MRIIVSAIDKGGDHELSHDLNFQQERYEAEHKIVSALGRRACNLDPPADATSIKIDVQEPQAQPTRETQGIRSGRCWRRRERGQAKAGRRVRQEEEEIRKGGT